MTPSPLANKAGSSRPGITLIELTVVILVLLGLISVLFIGARAWKRGSDRGLAVIIIRNAQIGMRSHSNVMGIEGSSSYPGLPLELFGIDKFIPNGIDKATGLQKSIGELPDHPSLSQSFDFVDGSGETIPELGVLYIATGGSTGLSDFTFNPRPSEYGGW